MFTITLKMQRGLLNQVSDSSNTIAWFEGAGWLASSISVPIAAYFWLLYLHLPDFL
ncbi:hypothetical protein [Xylella fastidiosa]|uniref:hypothetical protein n=1 Tax=Xylella fastidiosa TaxID=2371 RepID=UPI00031CD631|nr:hypothetical protein [Xylella fastidiosa]